MKISKVQINCLDNVPNQDLIPSLYSSNLASRPLRKHSFLYLAICLVHKYLLSIYCVPALSGLWRHNGDVTLLF